MINKKTPDFPSGDIEDFGAILALDLGKKRVGVALTHGVVAEVQKTIVLNEQKSDEFFLKLKKIIKEQKVQKIIIGLPLGKDLKETKQSVWTRYFGLKIRQELNLPIEYIEESFSSTLAFDNLEPKKRHNKEDIDAESAKIILEQYLNSK